ncbi:uncharacterized protein ACR2FA_010654 [Aphomia sociella]
MCNMFPKQVCNECKEKMYNAYVFKRRCIKSETILDDILNTYKHELDKTLDHPNTIIEEKVPIETFDIVVQEPLQANISVNNLNSSQKVDGNDKIKLELKDDVESVNGDSHDYDDSSFDSIKQEILTHKTEEDTLDINNSSKSKKQLNFNNKKKYMCHKCNIQFDSLKQWKSHRKVHSTVVEVLEYQCSMCNHKFARKSSLTNHIRHHKVKEGIKFTCVTCKREFKHQAHLDNHILAMHTCNDGITCTYCNKGFTTKESLELHLESHKTEKKHQCKICNKSFYMPSTLTDHMRTHTGEKPFLCSICGRGFSQNNNLRQHMMRHQGHKPFKCEECERSFVSKGELQAHKRKHSGAHPFVCDDCGNGFTTSSSLVKHRRVHTGERPYPCEFCPMRFKASNTLKNHRRTHTGEKPFQCNHCEKAFVQRNDLVSHIRCHTGERPYVCTTCGQSYRKASSLKVHVKIHNKEREMNVSLLHDMSVS